MYTQNYYVYVASESDDTVSLLKFDKNEIEEVDRITVGTFPTEIEGPHGITVDPSGDYWYLSLAHGNPFGKLVKYSTKTNEIVDETILGLFPATMQISTVTGFLYCVNFNLHGDMKPSTVSVVDPETMTEILKIRTGSMPHGSRISSDGLYQYSVAMMSGELFEIDALSLKVNRVLDLENMMNDHKQMGHDKMDHGNMNHDIKKDNKMMDKKNSAKYDANLKKANAKIDGLVSEINKVINKNAKYVVFHDAYQYFETSFDFPAAGAISLGDATDPSAARIAEIQDRVRDEGINCVLSEPQFNANLVETVTSGTDAKTGVIDPLGLGLEPGSKLYGDLIRNMAKALAGCL